MKTKLLRSLIDKLEPRDSAYDVYDTALAGFAVRVNPGGAKTYIVRYRPRGGGRAINPRTFTLGRHPALIPEQARDQARDVLAAVAAGKDPAERPTVVVSVSKILDDYLAYLKGRPSLRVAKGDVANHLKPAFGHLLPREVTAVRVRRFYNRLEESDHERRASACLSLLRTAFKRAGLEPPSLGHIKLTTWVNRERTATRDELRAVLTTCRNMLGNEEGWPWAIYLVLLLILTGARPGEIRTAKLADVDVQRGLLIRKEHKTRRKTRKPREIALNAAALELIEAMPKISGNPYLIPGRKVGTHLAEYGTAWRRICEKANVTGLWVYDLRRTFTNIGLGQGFTLDQLGKALGHSHAATTAGYAWLLPTERDRIAAQIGAEIAGLLPGLVSSPRPGRAGTEPADPP